MVGYKFKYRYSNKPLSSSKDGSLSMLTKGEFTKDKNYTIEYYKYNDFNQLVGYSNNKGTKASYEYLPNGLRSSKTVGGIKTGQVWDGQNLFLEIDSNGNIASQYEYGLDMIRNKNTNTYYNYDAHGDVVQLTDANGTVKADYTYDAFGNQKTSTNNTNPFRYCGEYYDNESGLIYLRNRYYNPSTGRFINEDPIRSGGNWYSYCNGNLLSFIDPSGLAMEQNELFLNYIKLRCSLYDYYNSPGNCMSMSNATRREIANITFDTIFETDDFYGTVYETPNIALQYSNDDNYTTCWAACDMYVANYSKKVDSNSFKEEVNNWRDTIKDSGKNVDSGWHVNSSEVRFDPSFDDIVNTLDAANGPIYATLKNNPQDKTGHAIVICGAYQYKDEFDNTKSKVIAYNPNFVELIYYDYSDGVLTGKYNDYDLDPTFIDNISIPNLNN